MDGWLRSLMIISLRSFSDHSLKFVQYPSFPGVPTFHPSIHFLLGSSHSSNASPITRNPFSSQSSRKSGENGLWLVLMALHPDSFRISNLRAITCLGTAEPRVPASWCIQIPFNFRFFPLRKKPFSASNFMLLIPKEVTCWSNISFPFTTVISEYRLGLSISHNEGPNISMV